jgi:predicted dehydrogenase
MAKSEVNIAIVGLGFGAEFIPIYQKHPHANLYAICQRSEADLNRVGDAFNVDPDRRYRSYEELLADPAVDAVHINTPIQLHAEHTLMALRAGKHVACTVPMATTVEDCRKIVELVAETGLKYMMAETVVYSREYLFVKELYEKGELGRIQYLQASHPQDMEGWPDYWQYMKPMHYATHVVSPVLGLTNKEAEYVSCFGSGRISDELAAKSGCSFAVESCHIKLTNSDLSAQIYRSLFDTARQYRESFDVYGSKKSFEWPLIEGESPVLHTAKKPEPEIPERVTVPADALRKLT